MPFNSSVSQSRVTVSPWCRVHREGYARIVPVCLRKRNPCLLFSSRKCQKHGAGWLDGAVNTVSPRLQRIYECAGSDGNDSQCSVPDCNPSSSRLSWGFTSSGVKIHFNAKRPTSAARHAESSSSFHSFHSPRQHARTSQPNLPPCVAHSELFNSPRRPQNKQARMRKRPAEDLNLNPQNLQPLSSMKPA